MKLFSIIGPVIAIIALMTGFVTWGASEIKDNRDLVYDQSSVVVDMIKEDCNKQFTLKTDFEIVKTSLDFHSKSLSRIKNDVKSLKTEVNELKIETKVGLKEIDGKLSQIQRMLR